MCKSLSGERDHKGVTCTVDPGQCGRWGGVVASESHCASAPSPGSRPVIGTAAPRRGRHELTRSLLARKYGVMGALAVRWPWQSYFTPSRRLFCDMLTGSRPETIGIRVDLVDEESGEKA